MNNHCRYLLSLLTLINSVSSQAMIMKIQRIFFSICLFASLNVVAQNDVLVPYRVGDKFGLSDVKGKIKVKPVYDNMEPIGGGFYKYSKYEMRLDTTHYKSGWVDVKEKMTRITGVYSGSRRIIGDTKHNHFTYAEQGLLIGSEESYISKNSNFYNFDGERMLSENVEKFKFIGGSDIEIETGSYSSIISIIAEHYDGTVSLLLFDGKTRKMLKPALDRVSNFEIDRDEATAHYFVCSYSDSEGNYYRSKVYFDPEKQHYVVGPYTYEYNYSDSYNREGTGEYVGEGTYSGDYEVVEAPMEREPVEDDGVQEQSVIPPLQISKPKPVYPFLKINKTSVKCGNDTINAGAGETFLFYDRYSNSQIQPLIVAGNKRYALLFSDSLNYSVQYDSLRYIKNQYGIFTFSHSIVYLAGNRDEDSGKWKFGVLDQNGREIIPMVYEYLSPNLPESYYEREEKTKAQTIKFRQPYDYGDEKDRLLTLTTDGLLVASKNGKQGVINLRNELLMPFEFDNLWKNGLSFLTTYKVDEDFYVYQKGNSYGVFRFDHKQTKSLDTGLIFSRIPVFVYRDYMGVKGLDIYNLADIDTLYFCLQSGDGTLYYKEK